MPAARQCLSPSRVRLLRAAALALLGLVGVVLVLLLVHRGLLPLLAWIFPYLEKPFYDLAVYGAYRQQRYVSFDLPSPEASFVRWEDECNTGFVFVAPQGPSVGKPGPTILDPLGGLVWTSDEYDVVMNFQMQQYRGENFLTFWAGNKQGSMGEGAMYMLDSEYNVAHKIHAVGGNLRGDLHEFTITDQGTALVTVYNKTNFDLRPMGWLRTAHGWIVDSIFQEIDIETGDLLFEWRASDHYRPEDSFYLHPLGGYISAIPFDFYHINSIQKDSKGNFLICSRHMHTITYIHGTSGETIWVLGGDSDDFIDLSDGRATDFKWQHHARWISEEEGIISLFDNGGAGPLHVDAPYSKGTLLQLDVNNLTATYVQSYVSLGQTTAASQGSVQLLPNNHIFIGWGSSAAYSEYKMDSTLLCEVHLAASCTFWWERVKSYRTYKVHGWVGRPAYPPSTKIRGGNLYVSWNGATEVKLWELQGTKDDAEDEQFYEHIDIIEKRSFEEAFVLPTDGDYVRYRVVALDVEKQAMRFSEPVDVGADKSSALGTILGICVGVGSLVGVWYLLKTGARRWHGKFRRWEPIANVFSLEKYRYSRL